MHWYREQPKITKFFFKEKRTSITESELNLLIKRSDSGLTQTNIAHILSQNIYVETLRQSDITAIFDQKCPIPYIGTISKDIGFTRHFSDTSV